MTSGQKVKLRKVGIGSNTLEPTQRTNGTKLSLQEGCIFQIQPFGSKFAYILFEPKCCIHILPYKVKCNIPTQMVLYMQKETNNIHTSSYLLVY